MTFRNRSTEILIDRFQERLASIQFQFGMLKAHHCAEPDHMKALILTFIDQLNGLKKDAYIVGLQNALKRELELMEEEPAETWPAEIE
jgi:ABC-type nickel/cobalt efflux system permease component RcnA